MCPILGALYALGGCEQGLRRIQGVHIIYSIKQRDRAPYMRSTHHNNDGIRAQERIAKEPIPSRSLSELQLGKRRVDREREGEGGIPKNPAAGMASIAIGALMLHVSLFLRSGCGLFLAKCKEGLPYIAPGLVCCLPQDASPRMFGSCQSCHSLG